MTEPVDLLAFAAHPDDAEVGCGGALALSAAAGLRVAVADLTGGERSTAGTPELRQREGRAAGEVLGLAERLTLGLPDTRIGTEPGHRDRLVAVLRELRPRVVLAPHVEDRHPDHAATGRLVREACFYGGVANVGEGAPHRPDRLYHYVLHHPFEPTFVLDVTAVWEQRVAAVEAYVSQFGEPGSPRETELAAGGGFLELIAARAAFYGAMVGVARGEPFMSRGPLPVDELPGLAAPGAAGMRRYRSFL